MPARIEDYALLGDTHAAALVSREGSIDWLCLPRFDSGACFAALLGDERHGRWKIAPAAAVRGTRRRYREGTLVLDTEFATDSGAVRVTDCMPPRETRPDVVRVVEGLRGEVPMRMELEIRFDYGSIVPWVRRTDGALRAVGGPDALELRSGVPTRGRGMATEAEFVVRAGERVPFVLSWHWSHEPPPRAIEAGAAIEDTCAWWREWSRRCRHSGPWREAVSGSLVVLKALTYRPTGGIVAAATTSLPEKVGGTRNWDYRYCWLRDATFTLYALLGNGYLDEAREWRDWLLRAVAGSAQGLQIMYGVAGERRLPELELGWLPGYEGSAPVRVGNAAVEQRQLDVFGELMDVMYLARREGLPPDRWSWALQSNLLQFLEEAWREPDEGIWEMRGPRRHFVHSKVMAWVAFDRAVRSIEALGLEGPVGRWRAARDAVHDEVCRRGFDPRRGAFTQAYGSANLDASLLMMPLVGFLPADDPRVAGTVRAIERELLVDGLVLRYRTEETEDGLPPGEGAFLPCSFWLADVQALGGRAAEARELFERLLDLRNDVGLLSEEYDPRARRMLGNFPQAFSHVGLINTASNLTPSARHPASERPR
jgi:GH15 family glucan-1,4-alpha-glucosidase